MSELKVHKIGDLCFDFKMGKDVGIDFYLKSEADKVISEKDETIDELKEHVDELQKATDSAWSKVNTMYDELRHQKFKRCLAMARWCYASSEIERTFDADKYAKWYMKWYYRWAKIADKFMEEK